jgi:mono/diheme cytochrome c family protein
MRLSIALAILAGCGPREPQSASVADSATATSSPATSVDNRGATVYKSKCSFCHQSNGQGVSGSYPPLAGSDLVTGDPARLVRIVANGMQGPITIRGVRYDNSMPGWRSFLSPADIAEVSNYLRASWGNGAPPISAAFADSVASAAAAQSEPFIVPRK